MKRSSRKIKLCIEVFINKLLSYIQIKEYIGGIILEQFTQQLNALANRFEKIRENILTEEATKTSLILPFIQVLGYDVFNPQELVPEYIADVGIKKGEKIDYAIMQGNDPIILIEAKCINEKLEKHDSQLYRYFGTTKAKFAILTNGMEYKLFTDLDEPNKMDEKPFFTFNLLDLKDSQYYEIAKFRKNDFNIENVLNSASELKFTNAIKILLSKEWDDPSDEIIKHILNDVYPGIKTKKVIDSFRDIVKKSMSQFITEKVNEKLQKALKSTTSGEQIIETELSNEENGQRETEYKDQVITTEEEIEGYVLIKLILKEFMDPTRIYYRDNKSYFNVLLDDSIRKWVCRLGFNSTNKYIQLNDEKKTFIKIDSVNEIMNYKEEIASVARQFDKTSTISST
jgi:predicted type IV restriction endonuclease